MDTDKPHGAGEMKVRSRWVARDLKPEGNDIAKIYLVRRSLLSRQATRRNDGKERKTMFTDVKKAHHVPESHEDMYVELPEEAGAQKDECGSCRAGSTDAGVQGKLGRITTPRC